MESSAQGDKSRQALSVIENSEETPRITASSVSEYSVQRETSRETISVIEHTEEIPRITALSVPESSVQGDTARETISVIGHTEEIPRITALSAPESSVQGDTSRETISVTPVLESSVQEDKSQRPLTVARTVNFDPLDAGETVYSEKSDIHERDTKFSHRITNQKTVLAFEEKQDKFNRLTSNLGDDDADHRDDYIKEVQNLKIEYGRYKKAHFAGELDFLEKEKVYSAKEEQSLFSQEEKDQFHIFSKPCSREGGRHTNTLS